MPKVTDEVMEERRSQIVEAAMRVFARKGLSRATLRDVFKEAGLSAGAVYNYFRSRDDIVLAVTQAGMSEALAAFDGGDSRSARLDDVIDLFFATLERIASSEAPRVDLMIVTEALANADVRRAVLKNRAAVKAALTRLVGDRQDSDPRWRGHPAPVLADLLYCHYQGAIMSLALGESIDIPATAGALKSMRFA